MRIDYPIAIDSDHAIWRAFNNEYWPALYFVDAQGHIRHHQFGEGDYEQSEIIIQQLLVEAGNNGIGGELVTVDAHGVEAAADWASLKSPENYVGYERTENFASPGGAVSVKRHRYAVPARLRLNHWALSGDWTVEEQAAVLNESNRQSRRLRGVERALLGIADRREAVRRPGSRAGGRRQFGGPGGSYLASQATKVWLLVRASGLAASMSRYLVDRIAGLANVELVTEAQISRLEGSDGMLQTVRWRRGTQGEEVRRDIRHLFLFIGAEPNTDWLAGFGVALDDKGFVLTGADTASGRRLLETSRRGVFAIGDVRSGSVKRVAAAVGEGAQVVATLHAHLAATQREPAVAPPPGRS